MADFAYPSFLSKITNSWNFNPSQILLKTEQLAKGGNTPGMGTSSSGAGVTGCVFVEYDYHEDY